MSSSPTWAASLSTRQKSYVRAGKISPPVLPPRKKKEKKKKEESEPNRFVYMSLGVVAGLITNEKVEVTGKGHFSSEFDVQLCMLFPP